MNVEEALKFVEELLAERGKRLNDVQRAVFRGVWEGKSYKEIRQDYPGRTLEHLMRNVGPELWKLLGETIGERITKSNLRGPLERAQTKRLTLVDAPVSVSFEFEGANSENNPEETASPQREPSYPLVEHEDDNLFWNAPNPRQDWGNAPDVSAFYGRYRELTQLEQWIKIDGCHLIALCGVGGIGKTDLSVKVAQRVRDQFECLVWRSLSNWRSPNFPPSLEELLANLIRVLSNHQDTSANLSQLLYYLNHHSCFIVLDGFEAVLQSGVHNGSYRKGYEDYREFLREVGRIRQSCVVITSREKPKEIARMEGETNRVRSLRIEGLGELGGQEIFVAKGMFSGTEGDWGTLIRRYAGNPLALKVVATRVLEVFSGEIAYFLDQLGEDSAVFGDICDVLAQQFERLSELEQNIIRHLATHPGPVAVENLQTLVQPSSRMQLLEGLESLMRRSLVEVDSARYLLHPLMMEYITEKLTEKNS